MNLLDRIKKEHESPTVKVPPRQDELIPKTDAQPVKSEPIVQQEESPEPNEAHGEADASGIAIASLERELETLPSVSNKKIGVRLEEEIYEDIRRLCQDNNITVETLLEAYFTVCRSQPTLVETIIEEAQSRLKRRTKAGNIRSLLTKAKNLKGK